MNTREDFIKETEQQMPQNKMQLEERETLPEVLRHSTDFFDEAKSQPESILINTAQRLSNVAHSLIEEAEKAYLEDGQSPPISAIRVDDTVKLCAEAREHLKLALVYKSERVKAMREFLDMRLEIEKQ